MGKDKKEEEQPKEAEVKEEAAPAAEEKPKEEKKEKPKPKKGGGKVRPSIKKGDAYDDKGGRKRPVCPKCGPGIFMATHKDRLSCGKCGYTEFTKKQ